VAFVVGRVFKAADFHWGKACPKGLPTQGGSHLERVAFGWAKEMGSHWGRGEGRTTC